MQSVHDGFEPVEVRRPTTIFFSGMEMALRMTKSEILRKSTTTKTTYHIYSKAKSDKKIAAPVNHDESGAMKASPHCQWKGKAVISL